MRLLALFLLLALTACADVTGPGDDPLPPGPASAPGGLELRFTERAAGGASAFCSRPTASSECFRKFVMLIGAAGSAAGSCSTFVACGLGLGGIYAAGLDYSNTPDCRACMAPRPILAPDWRRPLEPEEDTP